MGATRAAATAPPAQQTRVRSAVWGARRCRYVEITVYTQYLGEV